MYVFILTGLNVAEDVFYGPRDNAPFIVNHVIPEALHGVGLSGAGLAIGKDGGIIAFQGTADW